MKTISRLTQLTIFTAGPKLRHEVLNGDKVIINRYGDYPIYQTDWLYYRAMMQIALESPDTICKTTIPALIRRANKLNNQSSRQAVANLLLSLTGTYLVVNKNNQTILSSSLVDHFSFSLDSKQNEICFVFNSDILQFWKAGEWDHEDDTARCHIGSSNLALWIYSLFKINDLFVSPEFDLLYDMAGINIVKHRIF